MSRSRISPRSTRNNGAASLSLVLLLLAFSLLPARPALAAEPVTVLAQTQTVDFSKSIDFMLQVQADRTIEEAILFYGRVGQPLVRRIYPDMTPDSSLALDYTEDLEHGQFEPGTRFRAWWRLVLDDGTVFETDPATFDYSDSRFDWQLLAGDQVDLYWYGKQGQQAKTLLGVAEEAVTRLQTEIGVSLTERAQIYVYNSQSDMALALSQRSEGYDDRVLTLGVAVDERTLLLLGSHRDVERTVAHELSHIVVGLATDNPYSALPSWLDEGLAMYAEGQLPDENVQALDDAVHLDALLSLRSLSSYTGQAGEVDLFYAESYSVVSYLLDTYGRDKMTQLLAVFAEGTLQDDALRQVYGFGLDDLDDQWRGSLGLAPRPTQTPSGTSVQIMPVWQGA